LVFGNAGIFDQSAHNKAVVRVRLALFINHCRMSLPCDPTGIAENGSSGATSLREWPVRPGAVSLGVQAAPATAGFDWTVPPALPKVLHISNCATNPIGLTSHM